MMHMTHQMASHRKRKWANGGNCQTYCYVWRERVIDMLENFFGEEIEKTVFLSAAQMREAHPGPVRGKYFKDTAIFNIFPPELSERGEFLGQILSGRL